MLSLLNEARSLSCIYCLGPPRASPPYNQHTAASGSSHAHHFSTASVTACANIRRYFQIKPTRTTCKLCVCGSELSVHSEYSVCVSAEPLVRALLCAAVGAKVVHILETINTERNETAPE